MTTSRIYRSVAKPTLLAPISNWVYTFCKNASPTTQLESLLDEAIAPMHRSDPRLVGPRLNSAGAMLKAWPLKVRETAGTDEQGKLNVLAPSCREPGIAA